MGVDKFAEKTCKPCEGGVAPLTKEQAQEMLREFSGWQMNPAGTEIYRVFEFKNFYRTIAFVNAIAWVAHRENHHPDLKVSYNRCMVYYTTHAINGLSENDFICASKVDAIYKFGPA